MTRNSRASFVRRSVLAVVVGFSCTLAPAFAIDLRTGSSTTPTIRGGVSTAPRLGLKVTSLHEQRWARVVRQRSEIGCSAAALATILTHYFGFPTDEDQMIQALYSEALMAPAPDLEADLIYRGFNMRHMQNVARKGGLIAQAFRVEPEDLHAVKLPVITRVTIKGYDHFVVFRAASRGRVYIADPAFGNTIYSMKDFTKIWSGVMLGFLNRSGKPVAEHELEVFENDRRVVSWNEISRDIGRGNDSRFLNSTRDVVRTLSLFDFVQPQVDGLRSAFPTYIYNSREF